MISAKAKEYFSTARQVQISLPSQGLVPTQLSCLLRYEAPNFLLARLPEGSEPLSALDLDLEGTVFCFCSADETIYHFYARIDKILAAHELRLAITEATVYPQRRRFFRVDADVALKCRPARTDDGRYICEAENKKVNLSAVGLQFETRQHLKHGEEVKLEMQLPGDEPVQVRCTGRVVRVIFSEDNQVERVAIDLVKILPEEQEKLIKFCLAVQRRQIRLKVRVFDSGLG